jgi:hypothetical protein
MPLGLWSVAHIAETLHNCAPLRGMSKKGRIKRAIGRAYERFLELPVPLVLVVLWLAGLAVFSSLALAFYLYVSSLAGV